MTTAYLYLHEYNFIAFFINVHVFFNKFLLQKYSADAVTDMSKMKTLAKNIQDERILRLLVLIKTVKANPLGEATAMKCV